MKPVQSWGRLSNNDHKVVPISDPSCVFKALHLGVPAIAYGNGRSYGDVCLNPGGALLHMLGLNHFVSWDPHSGILTCESGVLLQDIQRLLIPQGWILPVTPGTLLVTVGGAISNDVHGKNHHAKGSFGDHVRRLWLARSTGSIIECSPSRQADWFEATVGGMGLTGIIMQAELQLRRVSGPWMDAEILPYSGLGDFLTLADDSEVNWEHTVSWIDCLAGEAARGIFMRANPSAEKKGARPQGFKRKFPTNSPVSLVNKMTLRPLNEIYYRIMHWRSGRSLVHCESFLYPLDGLSNWNRLYGPKGFYQYQSVVPRHVGVDATRAMLREIYRSREGSFLAVLKTFGDRPSPGMLSFPRKGVTLALDFPNRGERTLRLFERLDAIVLEAGGSIYPAKDARMSREIFEAGNPRLEEFLKFRDPNISSSLSRRLFGS